MEKALTVLEAWKDVPLKHTLGVEDAFANGFAAGRVGMIPESEAVRIPPVSEWKHLDGLLANGLAVYAFQTLHGEEEQQWQRVVTDDGVELDFVAYIPRPVPAWTPKVGEAVFAVLGSLGPVVCRCEAVHSEGSVTVTRPDGWNASVSIEYIKPFNASKIGKPWDEIPGGVE